MLEEGAGTRGYKDANDQTLLATCTHYSQLDAKENTRVFLRYKETTLMLTFQILLSFNKLQSYDIKMLDLE